ncbi:hypothetical protein BCR39DRAFT_368462 [Naematelia encephala]|uniref:Uncharacterized protein n=1 Tax=Naematelia encephala TaxID=71784 RepID=A0A1Y2AK09_9TREE|nr:hypothetical protein BCR39DRAFT_368462 [Naematelia encephala]
MPHISPYAVFPAPTIGQLDSHRAQRRLRLAEVRAAQEKIVVDVSVPSLSSMFDFGPPRQRFTQRVLHALAREKQHASADVLINISHSVMDSLVSSFCTSGAYALHSNALVFGPDGSVEITLDPVQRARTKKQLKLQVTDETCSSGYLGRKSPSRTQPPSSCRFEGLMGHGARLSSCPKLESLRSVSLTGNERKRS